MNRVHTKPLSDSDKRKDLEGDISVDQLRDIIRREAALLQLSFDDAVTRAKARTLPRNHIGDDISLLVELLPA